MLIHNYKINTQQHTVQSKFWSGANSSQQSIAGWTIHRECWRVVNVGVKVLFTKNNIITLTPSYLYLMLNLIMLWLKLSSVQVCHSRIAHKGDTELVTLTKNINIKVTGIHELEHIIKALWRSHYVIKAITLTAFNTTNVQIMAMVYDHFHVANLTHINNRHLYLTGFSWLSIHGRSDV
jgi:hypothetical protein